MHCEAVLHYYEFYCFSWKHTLLRFADSTYDLAYPDGFSLTQFEWNLDTFKVTVNQSVE